MKKASILFAVLSLLGSTQAFAQQYTSTANQCLREYYNPNNYNWLTYENTCDQALYVVLVTNSGGSWALDFSPGSNSGPGLSANEVRAAGGIHAYACPAGYVPVDPNDNLIRSRPYSQYRCKQN
jgi:hypothetical protein